MNFQQKLAGGSNVVQIAEGSASNFGGNTTFAGNLFIKTTTASSTNGQSLPGYLEFQGFGWDTNSGSDAIGGRITLGGSYSGVTSGGVIPHLAFAIQNSGDAGSTSETMDEHMRIVGNGAVCIARTSVLSPTAKLVVSAGATGGTTPAMSIQGNTSTSSGSIVVFHTGDGTEEGSIGASNLNAGSGVSFNTSSDYRLKEKVKTLPNALDRVNKMKPVEFEWKKSKSKSEGFLAHELQEICDYAVSGEKDADSMQQVDYAKITPILVKAVQELSAKVEALENA